MNFLTAIHTDIGTRKQTNQDSMLLMQASTSAGEVVFAVICDGMGGLKKGEVASAEVVRALATWFRERFPEMLKQGFDPARLRSEWKALVERQNERISRYGAHAGMRLGTTLVGLLCMENQFYIINVGDSRVYQVEQGRLLQLTHDHTLIQQEIDTGRLTPEQAERDPRRSVLLQCVGAGGGVEPDFFGGRVEPEQTYLLCSDGFRHVIQPEEFCRLLHPGVLLDEPGMTQQLVRITDEVKRRGETDNISAILIRTCV